MAWKGAFFGALSGLLLTGRPWGAIFGAVIGFMFDLSGGFGGISGAWAPGAAATASVSEVFFRTTFELMGHVAKSDGRVSEAEIDAARRLMQDLNLGPHEISIAIACFRTGKSPGYDASSSVEHLRKSCGLRHDVLRAFMELQLRAALAGNGISPPARSILMRAAGRLGIAEIEFARMESAARARQQRGRDSASRQGADRTLSDCYAELEVNANMSDQEVTKAYRRQMSRHHPDKLVAKGLPESMAQVAKEKTQRIQEAYEVIRTARGMR
jgi:DnaJ like chaperone protein